MNGFRAERDSEDEMDEQLTMRELEIRRKKVERFTQQVSLKNRQRDDYLYGKKLRTSLDKFQMKTGFQEVVNAINHDVGATSPSKLVAQPKISSSDASRRYSPAHPVPIAKPHSSSRALVKSNSPSNSLAQHGTGFRSSTGGSPSQRASQIGCSRRLDYDDLDSSSSADSDDEATRAPAYRSPNKSYRSPNKSYRSPSKASNSYTGHKDVLVKSYPASRRSQEHVGTDSDSSADELETSFRAAVSSVRSNSQVSMARRKPEKAIPLPFSTPVGRGLLKENQRLKETVNSLMLQLENSQRASENVRHTQSDDAKAVAKPENRIHALEDKLALAMHKCDDLLGLVSLGLKEFSAPKPARRIPQPEPEPAPQPTGFAARVASIAAAGRAVALTSELDTFHADREPAAASSFSRGEGEGERSRARTQQFGEISPIPTRSHGIASRLSPETHLIRSTLVTQVSKPEGERRWRAERRGGDARERRELSGDGRQPRGGGGEGDERQRIGFLDSILRRVMDEESVAEGSPLRPERSPDKRIPFGAY